MSENSVLNDRLDIFVTIGTDHHQFTRLIDWLDEWLEKNPSHAERTLVQHGQSRASHHARNQAFFDFDELQQTIARADAIIVHGGPGSIFEARAAGRLPIAVPRDSAHDEVVDDHQQRFARYLADDGLVTLCETKERFWAALDQVMADPNTARLAQADERVTETIINLSAVLDDVTTGANPSLLDQPGWKRMTRVIRQR